MQGVVLARLTKAALGEVEPLWQRLNAMHANTSPHFGEVYRQLNFDQRMSSLYRIEEDDICILAAKNESNTIIGYVIALSSEGRGEIDSLYVDEAFRRYGVGRRLCEAVMDWMRERECRSMVVAVSVGNESALPFYQSLGFCERLIYLQHKG